jgi:pSer/pThr/pTyr-binding forkhead associated (FHA) protein
MTIQTDVAYLIYLDADAIPIVRSMTLGNHLDNDVVIAGEDVSDYHLRIELSGRGPVVVPLANNTVNVNGTETDKPVQVIIGDVITVGQSTMQIGFEVEAASEAEVWALHAEKADAGIPIAGEISVGRSDAADVTIDDHHISRFHARLLERSGFVWIQDLGSANGTRVNGQLLKGGVRLFHGDAVAFDKTTFQLIGQGGELTPVNRFEDPFRGTALDAPPMQADTTEFLPIAGDEPGVSPAVTAEASPGAALVGVVPPVEGRVFHLAVGDNRIGRDRHCDVCIDDGSVSQQHAQLTVKPEGTTLSDLMSTNGVLVNGVQVRTATLADDDVVQLGRVSLIFKEGSGSLSSDMNGAQSWYWIAGAALILIGLIVALF